MQSLSRLTLSLCSLWALTLLYGEMFAYWIPLWSCSWPQLHPSSSSSSVDNQVKVAVLADPQLMDRTSLRLPSRSFALEIAQFYTDIYMRRSFHASIMPFKPDLVVFLGDHFDGGPFLSDQEWQESLSRFRHIFGLHEKGISSDIPFYYLSGNHDIGYTALHSRHPEVISRYEKEFGARNYLFSAGKRLFRVDLSQEIMYVLQFIMTIFLLTVWPTNGFGCWDFCGKCMTFISAMIKNLTTTSKEKDEEENCEYEMIWDAEGSMHLVKKATTKVPVMKSNVGLTARSNVVSRPTAKKQLQEPEASVLVEMKMEAKLDNGSKVPFLGKSKVRKLIPRVFRVFRLVVIIAAVNIPLYVMLLFKDWIDR
ncbi:hypothetical protein COCNU_05G007810 [Cocos nucifera]|uniref:Calcineurin-like phosphoesterase domain-containing protein n=1 Tax=Cocos nucifera TaxID=13894 RepID=A0A8K0N1J6_COCNU|nr:hypothetical protein COCNU_05G007810 [Cocos nucifera]